METTTFDSFFTSGQLQMCKVLFPLLPPQLRCQFAIFIKLQELRNAVNYVKLHPQGSFQGLQSPRGSEELISSILPYCDDEQKETLQHFHQSLQQMEQSDGGHDVCLFGREPFSLQKRIYCGFRRSFIRQWLSHYFQQRLFQGRNSAHGNHSSKECCRE